MKPAARPAPNASVFVAEVLFGAVVLPLRKELMTFMTNDPEPLTQHKDMFFANLRCVAVCIIMYRFVCIYIAYIYMYLYSNYKLVYIYIYNNCIYISPSAGKNMIGVASKTWQKARIHNGLTLTQCWQDRLPVLH